MRIKKATIAKVITIYIANDGTEFESEYDCKKYEEELNKNKLRAERIAKAETLRIPELDNVMPLCDEGMPNENNTYRWYKLETEDDYYALLDIYPCYPHRAEQFPDIVCIENCDCEPYSDDAYAYYLSEIKRTTERFWDRLGYKLTFEKKGE